MVKPLQWINNEEVRLNGRFSVEFETSCGGGKLKKSKKRYLLLLSNFDFSLIL